MRVPQWVKPGIWGGIIGAVAIMIVGFSWWGWTLGSTAESMAKEQADAAVVALLTPICVESFLKQPDAMMKLTEFQKTASWQQSQMVERVAGPPHQEATRRMQQWRGRVPNGS